MVLLRWLHGEGSLIGLATVIFGDIWIWTPSSFSFFFFFFFFFLLFQTKDKTSNSKALFTIMMGLGRTSHPTPNDDLSYEKQRSQK